MVTNMKLILTSIKIQIKKIRAYPNEAKMLFLYALFNVYSIMFFWSMIFLVTGVNNKDRNLIYLLVMMGTLSLGIGEIFFGLRDFEYMVQDGSLDKYLYRPRNMLMMILMEKVPFTNMVQQIIIGGFGIYYIITRFGIEVQTVNVFKSMGLLLFGNIYYHLIYGMITMLSIWIEKISTLRDLIFNFSIAKNYPLNIFPKTLQNLLTYVVPIALTTYFPTIVLMGEKVEGFRYIIISFLVLCLLFIKVYRNCIKKYSSNGG